MEYRVNGIGCQGERGTGVLEYWSVGGLENRRQIKHLLRMKMETQGIFSARGSGDLDHYSSTPTLPGYFKNQDKIPDFLFFC